MEWVNVFFVWWIDIIMDGCTSTVTGVPHRKIVYIKGFWHIPHLCSIHLPQPLQASKPVPLEDRPGIFSSSMTQYYLLPVIGTGSLKQCDIAL